MKRLILLFFYSIVFSLFCKAQQPGDNDPTFNTIDVGFGNGDGFDNSVNKVILQSDGKVVVGGSFTIFNGTSISKFIRLNTDGSPDATFSVGQGFNNTVYTAVVQTDGKIIAGGAFGFYNGAGRNYIARLNTNGSNDNTFNIGTGFNNTTSDIIIQPDNKIIVAGSFTSFNGTTSNRIIRLDANGSLDATFNIGIGFDNTALAVALQPDGKIIVVGNFTTFNGSSCNSVVSAKSCEIDHLRPV